MTPHECRPPEGTPDGTVCWLVHDHLPKSAVTWWSNTEHWVCFPLHASRKPAWMAKRGWRFHSIAEPPHE